MKNVDDLVFYLELNYWFLHVTRLTAIFGFNQWTFIVVCGFTVTMLYSFSFEFALFQVLCIVLTIVYLKCSGCCKKERVVPRWHTSSFFVIFGRKIFLRNSFYVVLMLNLLIYYRIDYLKVFFLQQDARIRRQFQTRSSWVLTMAFGPEFSFLLWINIGYLWFDLKIYL